MKDSKKSARKLLTEVSDSFDGQSNTNNHDVLFTDGPQILDIFGTTYYSHSTVPQVHFLNKLPLFNRLNPDEVRYIWDICRADPKRPMMIYTDSSLALRDVSQLVYVALL